MRIWGRYFRVAADNRDLNYDKYVVQGTEREPLAAYTSDNTQRLDVQGVQEKLLTTDYIRRILGIPLEAAHRREIPWSLPGNKCSACGNGSLHCCGLLLRCAANWGFDILWYRVRCLGRCGMEALFRGMMISMWACSGRTMRYF